MSSQFPARSITNWPVQPQKMSRSLKFMSIRRRGTELYVYLLDMLGFIHSLTTGNLVI